MIVFSKNSNHENENNYKTNATMTQTSPEVDAKQLCFMTDGQIKLDWEQGWRGKKTEHIIMQGMRKRIWNRVWWRRECESTH